MQNQLQHPAMGRKMQCVVTGFKGIVTAYAQYISGCDQLCLTPKAKKGDTNIPSGCYYDINRLEYIDKEKDRLTLTVDQGVRGAGQSPSKIN